MARVGDIEKFRRALQRVPPLVRDAVNDVIEQDAAEWVKLARQLAPKDPEDGTPLHDSIRHYRSDTGGQIVRAGGEKTTKDDVDYAVQQEFGNSRHPAQPFFWPSYRLLRKKWKGRRSRAVSKALKAASND